MIGSLARIRDYGRASPIAWDLPPVEELLVSGGDARLALDRASGLNAYGCRPAPRPEAIDFASSTASSISTRAFLRVEQARHALVAGGSAHFDALNGAARAELARLLGIDADGTEIVFAPSGTDAALVALAVARMLHASPLVSIVAADDETGRGMRHACYGRHFGEITPSGRGVTQGAPIAGLDHVQGIAAPMRDASGARSQAVIDAEILTAVERGIAKGNRVVLFAMHHSKLGGTCPSDACLEQIGACFGDTVQIVLDACQGRIGRHALRQHLARGRMVLITGSKFFAGPPLSGALLLPQAIAARAAEHGRPASGLRDYSTAGDWPSAWTRVRSALDPTPNVGQLLRWTAALEEMATFYSVPPADRDDMLRAFAAAVPRVMAEFDELHLLADAAARSDEDFPVRTIFPFVVWGQEGALSPEVCGKLYRALNRDVSGLLPSLRAEERRIAAQCCHIGQPVAIGGETPVGALRISAGARLVIGDPGAIDERLRLVFAKLRLLLRQRAAIEQAF